VCIYVVCERVCRYLVALQFEEDVSDLFADIFKSFLCFFLLVEHGPCLLLRLFESRLKRQQGTFLCCLFLFLCCAASVGDDVVCECEGDAFVFVLFCFARNMLVIVPDFLFRVRFLVLFACSPLRLHRSPC